MYMTQAKLRDDAVRRLAKKSSLGTYQRHQLVWELFEDPDAERDFLYSWTRNEFGDHSLLVVSEREPCDSDLFVAQTKPYEPSVKKGDRFVFKLTANTVVKRRENGRQVRHDVVMDRKHELRQAGQWPSSDISVEDLVRETGLDWLRPRAERAGFEFRDEEILIEAHRQLDFRKKRNGREIRLSVMDFRGRLKVTDSDLFVETLSAGIGPAKSFGCGLLLIRPV